MSQWVEKTEGVCGGDARVAGTRIPVWVLVREQTMGANLDTMLVRYPSLTREKLMGALEWAEAHPDEV